MIKRTFSYIAITSCQNLKVSALQSSNSCKTPRSLSMDKGKCSLFGTNARADLLNDMVEGDDWLGMDALIQSKLHLITPLTKIPQDTSFLYTYTLP